MTIFNLTLQRNIFFNYKFCNFILSAKSKGRLLNYGHNIKIKTKICIQVSNIERDLLNANLVIRNIHNTI